MPVPRGDVAPDAGSACTASRVALGVVLALWAVLVPGESAALSERQLAWRDLAPTAWRLPRRPVAATTALADVRRPVTAVIEPGT